MDTLTLDAIVKAERFLADNGWLYLKEHDLWIKDLTKGSPALTLGEALAHENQNTKERAINYNK